MTRAVELFPMIFDFALMAATIFVALRTYRRRRRARASRPRPVYAVEWTLKSSRS